MIVNRENGDSLENTGISFVKTPDGRLWNPNDYRTLLNNTKRESQKTYQIGDIVKLKISGYIIRITEIDYKNAETGEYDYAGILADGTYPERLYSFNQESVDCIVNRAASKNRNLGGTDERN